MLRSQIGLENYSDLPQLKRLFNQLALTNCIGSLLANIRKASVFMTLHNRCGLQQIEEEFFTLGI